MTFVIKQVFYRHWNVSPLLLRSYMIFFVKGNSSFKVVIMVFRENK